MSDPIKGQIIRISSEYEVLIDKGIENGVKYGDIFIIYDEGEEIYDLNGKSLGKLEIVKGKVKVEHAQKNFSICRAYRRTRINPLISSAIMSAIAVQGISEDTEVSPLDIDEHYLKDLDKEPRKIKLGDLVKQELN